MVGRSLSTIGRKRILVGGLCSMGLSMIGFGAADFSPNKGIFTFLIFALRFFQGGSSCAIQTTSYAVISMSFPEEQEKYIAVMQTAIGTGLILGPVIGTFLYSIFGFSMTFFLIGACFLGLTFLLSFLVPSSIDKKDEEVIPETARRISMYEEKVIPTTTEPIGFFKLLCTGKFLFAGLGGLMAMFMFCFMEPVLAFRLQEFNISPFLIGIFFSIQPVSYVVLSMGITWFTGNFANRGLLMAGGLLSSLCMAFVGPTHYLPDSLNLMALGQLCVGAFGLFLMVPAIPEMIQAGSIVYPKRVLELTDISASVFNCMLGVGQVIAPVFGSTLTKLYDFRTTCEVLGVLLMIYFVTYFILGDGLTLLRHGCKEKVKKEVDVVRNSPARNMHMRNRLFSNMSHDENFDLDTMKLIHTEHLLDVNEEKMEAA